MKKILLLSLILVGSATTRWPQPKAATTNHCSASGETALRQIAGLWKDGYNHGDAAGVASLYTEDAYYLTRHFVTGVVHGRAAIQAYVQRGVDAKYHADSIEIISRDYSGGLAYSVGRYESTNAGLKAFGVNVVVVKRIGN